MTAPVAAHSLQPAVSELPVLTAALIAGEERTLIVMETDGAASLISLAESNALDTTSQL